MELKAHWEKIYAEKSDREVSWYQESPEISARLIDELRVQFADPIIDIGAGNSNLTTILFEKGFSNLTVLDISGNSINRMQQKLGAAAKNINWIESDILKYDPPQKYRLWHDRAAFHFFTSEESKHVYKKKLMKALGKNGLFILSTFSNDGPEKCSGLDICQYNLPSLKSVFEDSFELLNAFNHDHKTPFNNSQSFIFSIWRKRE